MDTTAFESEAAPRDASDGAAPTAQTLAAEVRATFLLFGMVVLVTIGFSLASSLALRLLAS